MIKMEEKIKRELLGYFPTDLHLYWPSNEKINELKNEMELLGKQLMAAVKAGDLADFYEKEAPKIRYNLEIKKHNLDALVEIERKKQIRKTKPSTFFSKKVDIRAFGKKTIVVENASLVSDFNIYVAVATVFLLFCFQLTYNSYLENRMRVSVDVSMVRPPCRPSRDKGDGPRARQSKQSDRAHAA